MVGAAEGPCNGAWSRMVTSVEGASHHDGEAASKDCTMHNGGSRSDHISPTMLSKTRLLFKPNPFAAEV